jgi:hypothetical protein
MTGIEPDGRAAGWARNERDRLLIGVDATPAERLEWLEEMIRLAHRTGALPRPVVKDDESHGDATGSATR